MEMVRRTFENEMDTSFLLYKCITIFSAILRSGRLVQLVKTADHASFVLDKWR